MKKLFVLALTALLLAACGGGDTPDSLVKQAIREAEKKIPSEETPHLGKLPVLWAQYADAKNMLDGMIKMQVMEAHANFKKDGKKDENVMDALEKLSEAKEELKQIFQEKIIAEAIKLEGHTIPVDFDKSVFSDAKVVIYVSPDSNMFQPIKIDADLTLAAEELPLFLKGEARDKSDKEIENYELIMGLNGYDEETNHILLEVFLSDMGLADGIEKARIFEKIYFYKED